MTDRALKLSVNYLSTEGLHSCGYHCELPGCVLAQRNELVNRYVVFDDAVRRTAKAVVERWDTPLWKDVAATADFINRLRAALEGRDR